MPNKLSEQAQREVASRINTQADELGRMIDYSNEGYRNVVKLIDMAKGNPAGCIIELCTIAEVQVRWHIQDFEEKLSLYELIIKRIREATERL